MKKTAKTETTRAAAKQTIKDLSVSTKAGGVKGGRKAIPK